MKVLQGIIVALTIPLMFLNMFGMIVAGIWLIVVGDWKHLIEGVIALFTTTFLLSILLLPAIGLALPGVWFAKRNIVSGVLVFAGLANIYTIALAVVWCSFVLFHFMGEATSSTYFPLLVWSYGVATGPWSYMASKEASGDDGGDGSALIVFFIEFAFLVVIIVSLFTNLDRLTVIEIFGAIMALALVAQLVIVLLTTYAERESRALDQETSRSITHDPEILEGVVTIAAFHLEAGTTRRADYVVKMLEEFPNSNMTFHLETIYEEIGRVFDFEGMDDTTTDETHDSTSSERLAVREAVVKLHQQLLEEESFDEEYDDEEDNFEYEQAQAEIRRLESEIRQIEADQAKLQEEFVDKITEIAGDRETANEVMQELFFDAELDPGSAEYYAQQAHIHWKDGKRERALLFFNKALPEDRSDIWTRDDAITVMNRGNLQLELGNFDESILDLDCAAAIDSTLPTWNSQVLKLLKPEDREGLRQRSLNKIESEPVEPPKSKSRIIKYCKACDEGFADKFQFCPNCGGGLEAFELKPA